MSKRHFTPFTPFHTPFHFDKILYIKDLDKKNEKVKSKLQKSRQNTKELCRIYKKVLDFSFHPFTLSVQSIAIQLITKVKSPVKRYEKVKRSAI